MTDGLGFTTFVDANVLVKPLTRTLLAIAGEASGYRLAWSAHVEQEADRHMRSGQTPVSEVRALMGRELSKTGQGAQAFADTEPGDRQVLADAVAAGALFIVTEDVDDFSERDLGSVDIAAVNPDLFMSVKKTTGGYREALEFVSCLSKNPHLTPTEFHVRLGRAHPLTVEAHRASFPAATPMAATHNPPAVRYRGNRCLNCLQTGPADGGLCADCTSTR
ncbi:MAG: hypothetical protein LBK72_00455 [Bifidobacteriaceae bacterium]|jgi:hypothetical protein|nr:hypothetical protein [Bifidobacteriaceae bacterium]